MYFRLDYSNIVMIVVMIIIVIIMIIVIHMIKVICDSEEGGHTLYAAKNNFSEPSVSWLLLALL